MTDRSLYILIVPSWYFSAGSDTLTGRMFLHHAQALRELGHDARIWYPSFTILNRPFRRGKYEVEEDVPTCREQGWALPRWTPGLTRQWVRLAGRRLADHLVRNGKPDVIHAQSFLAAAICAELQRHMQVPFVYTERNSRWISRDLPLSLMPYIHNALRDAAAVTCVSHGLRERLAVQTNRPIAVIPPHVDERIFFPDATVSKADPFTFITAGEPAGVKGLEVLLDGFAAYVAQHPRCSAQLVLVDRIPEEKLLRARAGRLGLGQQVGFAGQLTQPSLADRFRRSHVYVSASRIETFGKAMAEALACGLPVVATPTDGAKDIVTDSSLGILLTGFTAEALAAGMSAMAESYPVVSPEVAVSSTARFGRKAVMHQWISLYQSVIP